jgi:hypothetical protein
VDDAILPEAFHQTVSFHLTQHLLALLLCEL